MDRVSTSNGPTPVLLACAHGTRDPAGQSAVAALVAAVRTALPDVTVVDTWVDVQEPDLAARTAELAGHDAVVVPLLLSAGYHVFVDMARAVRGTPRHRVAAALGPDRGLARIMARRLAEAVRVSGGPDVGPGDRIVMVAAGSSDPRAGEDCERTARLLTEEVGLPVTPAYLSAARPTLPEAVAEARRELGTPPEDRAGDDAAAERRGDPGCPEAPTESEIRAAAAGDAAVPPPCPVSPAHQPTTSATPRSGHGGAAGRVLVVPYLLAPGFFHGRALAAGADVTAEPLLVTGGEVPQELVALVVEHYREAAALA